MLGNFSFMAYIMVLHRAIRLKGDFFSTLGGELWGMSPWKQKGRVARSGNPAMSGAQKAGEP